ncbi:MAG: hypothetical protein JXR34_02925, partial [Bacteroidales bacterium]|nr:hypothetical protein [Bacteroidales bacterium]
PMRITILIILSILFMSLSAQTKTEKEYRIKKDKIPENAQKWMRQNFPEAKKIKWYQEVSNGKTTFEAKLKWKKTSYSVEFDSIGTLEDVEMTIDFEEIELEARKSIEQYFLGNYKKHKILKVQKQFSGDLSQFRQYLETPNQIGITTNYEIEFQGITSDSNELYEALFNQSGQLITRKTIKTEANLNLDF